MDDRLATVPPSPPLASSSMKRVSLPGPPGKDLEDGIRTHSAPEHTLTAAHLTVASRSKPQSWADGPCVEPPCIHLRLGRSVLLSQ